MTPAKLRKAAEDALRPAGQRRIQALAVIEETNAELLPLVLEARRNEVSFRRITALTGLSATTVESWVRKSEEPKDS